MIKPMVESLALRIAKAIKRVEPERTASVEVLKFSLEFLMNTFITLLIIVLIGTVTGKLGQTLLGLGAFVVLRFFSGGMHMGKAFHCSLLTTLLITLAPHLPLDKPFTIALSVVSAAILLVFAPSNIEGHARIPTKYFPLLKLASVLIALSNLVFLNATIALVQLIQAVTTVNLKRR